MNLSKGMLSAFHHKCFQLPHESSLYSNSKHESANQAIDSKNCSQYKFTLFLG